ncbi:MAG: class I SAM-dependent methyltransferase [Pseudomonadota bacterium]
MYFAREVPPKSVIEIAEEWDALAAIRLRQMSSGDDVTFSRIMMPTMFDFVNRQRPKSILDAGCGVGIFTDYLSRFFPNVIGIDPSKVSISLARSHFGERATFKNCSIEEFSDVSKKKFDVITANMVLMDAPDAAEFLSSVSRLLKRGGAFIFSVTHPCFWPRYYQYEHEPWFEYWREIFVESPFRISSDTEAIFPSTHIHRSFERYNSLISGAGLHFEFMREPFPDEKTQKMYKQPWQYPRYLIGICRKPRRLP